MSLEDRINKEVDAFPFNTMSTHVSREHLETYVEGFERAKKQASTLAAEADELMREMARDLEMGMEGFLELGDHDAAECLRITIERYNNWKEQNK